MLHVDRQAVLKRRRLWLLALLTLAAIATTTTGCEDPVSPNDDAGAAFDASAPTADASSPDVFQVEDDASTTDAAPHDGGVVVRPDSGIDAGIDTDASVDAGLDGIHVHGNIFPATERAESSRYKLRGRVSTNVLESTNGTQRLRGAFAPLQN
ncbi:MAG: hypothetical protein IPK13_16260 [Deltaproteobacteria bacterium]|nr:hypothetical protein [Deltaproteobacteria bacterium]